MKGSYEADENGFEIRIGSFHKKFSYSDIKKIYIDRDDYTYYDGYSGFKTDFEYTLTVIADIRQYVFNEKGDGCELSDLARYPAMWKRS